MGLTIYLTVTAWTGDQVAGCTVGSGCDLVLNSRWATLFGLPTSFWGFLAYASLGGISFIRRVDYQWELGWVVALFGVLFSVYLTSISFFELEAACPYCLTSLALMLASLGVVSYQMPPGLKGFSWGSWSLKTVPAAIIVVLALHLNFTGLGGEDSGIPEDPNLRALAEHLEEANAKFYGAYWCPHCEDQKAMFGASAHRLPYIECSPGGRRAPQSAICRAMNIRSYPTWIINGRRYTGRLTLKDLAQHSGYNSSF
ncbi:MAG: Vitamin K epoxide reductase [Deltaproteobacteria bacterium]|nr:Vitamin K epoxide reductase [Deltaproteobacteria bacterium]